ncbi:hexitol phosphatase HxpB [Avibacterium sp. 21-599]|uniref:hexitol phosphatase HxpB n=1 Tax=Avibacterium sp. 21-599 TaxID=2911528 RepID=UPI0022479993|nr:hexitol phosphatase HxpB [Avibacterium sp. 21-599]MCW9718289.1 hexitol phosphatase HxpB [Avibacterium sp. 21-599]
MKFQAVIFDMDGVLIDSEPFWKQAGIDVFDQIGIAVSQQEMQALTGMPAAGIIKTVYQRYQQMPVPVEEMVKRMNDCAISMILENKPLMPNVPETLEKLTALGCKLAVASASPRYLLEQITERCGIARYFQYLSSATELDYNKPHPQVYLHAAHQLEIDPQACLGIEDSVLGMTAVKAASMHCAVIPARMERNDPRWSLADYKLEQLTQIPELFA